MKRFLASICALVVLAIISLATVQSHAQDPDPTTAPKYTILGVKTQYVTDVLGQPLIKVSGYVTDDQDKPAQWSLVSLKSSATFLEPGVASTDEEGYFVFSQVWCNSAMLPDDKAQLEARTGFVLFPVNRLAVKTFTIPKY